MSWKMRAVLAANMFTCNFYDVRFPVFIGVWMMPYMPFFWRFPGHEKTHMAYRKKYKPYILKYKALISKYMPYIFRLFKHLNHKDLQKGQKWRQKHERQRGVLERLLTVFCYAGRGVFCVRGAGILRGRAENKSGDTMTFKLHDISLFEQDT